MIRRYTLGDLEVMTTQLGMFLKESVTFKDILYDREKISLLLKHNINSKSFFCNVAVDDNDKVVGGLCATVCSYTFSNEVYGMDLLFYISESKRSLRLATELVASYIQWGKDRGLREIRLASTTGVKTEKFNKLCEYVGFKPLGSIYSMEV